MITGPPGVGKSEFTVWIAGRNSAVWGFRAACCSEPCAEVKATGAFRYDSEDPPTHCMRHWKSGSLGLQGLWV